MAGRIRLFDRGPDSTETPISGKSNVIGYTGADILAKILAGGASAAPAHIGFIYGDTATPGASMNNPDDVALATRRVQDWDKITTDVAAAGANIAICPLVLPPSVSLDAASDGTLYTANMATFTSHTGAFTEYAYPTDGSTYAGTMDSLGSVYFYHAVLLNRKVEGTTITYTPFARVIVGSSPFTAKATNRELAVYWDIVFS